MASDPEHRPQSITSNVFVISQSNYITFSTGTVTGVDKEQFYGSDTHQRRMI